MKITSQNIYGILEDGYAFFKATAQGTVTCYPAQTIEVVSAFAVDTFLVKLSNASAVEQINNEEYYTVENEAVQAHRRLVVQNIVNLNRSSLKSAPILIVEKFHD